MAKHSRFLPPSLHIEAQGRDRRLIVVTNALLRGGFVHISIGLLKTALRRDLLQRVHRFGSPFATSGIFGTVLPELGRAMQSG